MSVSFHGFTLQRTESEDSRNDGDTCMIDIFDIADDYDAGDDVVPRAGIAFGDLKALRALGVCVTGITTRRGTSRSTASLWSRVATGT